MNTQQVECFMEVARCLSFSKAAKNLYISQPTLSRNIVQMEKELQVQLFRRSSFQGTQLTPAGERMYKAYSQTHDILETAISQARQLDKVKSYTMILGILEGQMLDKKLHQMISDFKAAYPNINMRIVRESFHALNDKLGKDELDIILTINYELEIKKGLATRDFYRLPTYMIIPKCAIPKEEKDVYDLSQFKDLTFVHASTDDAPLLLDLLYRTCQQAGFMPRMLFVESIAEQTMLLEMGAGAAGFNSLQTICYSPNVACVKVREFVPQDFSLAWKSESPNPAVSTFMDWYDKWNYTE